MAHLVDVCQLLLSRIFGGLAKQSAKLKCLAYGTAVEVNILLCNRQFLLCCNVSSITHLHDVSCLPLEGSISLPTINEH
jgi:hypothetical protein